MKLLRVKASHFKNCQDDTAIDLVAKSKKTTEDKEYELQEIAELKMPDLNAASLETAMSMIAGTARSMGIVVED